MASLHWVDYLIFVSFLLVSVCIGVYHSLTGGRQKTTQEFLMADRKLSVLPTMLSLLASYQSAIMILGNTAEMYNWGIQAWVVGLLAILLSTIIAERLFVPWIYPLGLTSTYEYFAMRFDSRAVAMLAASIGIVKAVLYMGIAIYAPSLALESACGIPVYISIPVMSFICTLYTMLGGMKAVIWTDVFQFLIMFIGLLTILIKGLIEVGGISKVFEYAAQENRLNYINFSFDFTVRHTFWNFLFGLAPTWGMIMGLQQASVQRYSATATLKNARLILITNVPTTMLMSGMGYVIGLTVLAYFASIQCDPLVNEDVSSGNQILVFFVNTIFADVKGFAGLFLVTLYSGALSSVSSSLSGSAANLWECILKQWFPNLDDSKATIINKTLVVLFGVVATAVAFLAAQMPGPVSQIAGTFGGATAGPLLGLFILGGAFPFVDWRGALAGGFSGIVMNLWVGIGSRFIPPVNHPLPPVSTSGCGGNGSDVTFSTVTSLYTNSTVSSLDEFIPQGTQKFYSISYLWYAPLGFITCITVACLTSIAIGLIQSEKTPRPQKKYLIPWRAALTLGKMPKIYEDEKRYDYQLTSTNDQNVVDEKVAADRL
ncbi:hypothetical protein CAPTEDRAFT_171192 [Capitella teleta]|uniref:Sodium-coupled monocarboxylate transporter 1 n=1 Tax=Capitella teleta TaxID=283909 RepID=R7V9V9_CAPTE|nr:hypothetical protein CAPTEDRAFT_171192 [Capitella teleta]|eukprot:ELU15287.1 hypothetical protein CAPTEDRAFT_171192 [Capitella teleta]